MRVLVTGGGGFLGHALVRELKAKSVSDLYVTDLQVVPETKFHACNLLDATAVSRLLEQIAPEQIYHLAGTFSNEYAQDFASNVDSTRNLLECVRQSGRATRILLIGSAAEYGCIREADNPVKEDQPLRPVSIYGWTKACQTLLAEFYHRVHGTDVVVARLFNLSGSGASDRLFVGRIERQLERLAKGEIKTIEVGSLDSTRDYLPVETAARQLEIVMRLGKGGEVYHVASGVPKRMRDFLKEMLQERGLSLDCVRQAPRQTEHKLDIPAIYADVSRTNQLAFRRDADSASPDIP